MSFKSPYRMFQGRRRAREQAMGFVPVFSPLDIPGLAFWLIGETETWQDVAMTIPAVANGDVVGGWEDQSGNANDVIQAAALQRPTLRTAGNGINGRSIVRGDGVNDLLVNAAAFLTGLNGTVFAVFRLIAPLVNNAGILSSADEASDVRFVLFRPYGTVANPNMEILQRNNDVLDQIRGTTTAILAATTYIGMWASDGAAYSMRVNGVAQVLAVVSGANNGDWFADTANRDNVVVFALKRLAEAGQMSGDVAEMLVYDGVTLTADEIDDIEAYLAGRWGVVLP